VFLAETKIATITSPGPLVVQFLENLPMDLTKMKYLATLLLVASAGIAAAATPKVSECFKVNALVKTDEVHYWADWTNSCPYTIDSVYVLVAFANKSNPYLGDGVWPMYFVTPGTHRVTRFTIPAAASGFESVNVRKITTDSVEALR
jgi:hypothetical protein